MSSRTATVLAPGRLHLGFLDPGGRAGRRFGSLGIALDEVATRVRAEISRGFSASGPEAERALNSLEKMDQCFRLPGGARINVEQAIPAHAGLGSGTQMALAVGTAVSRLYRLELEPREIASRLARGLRSGIGIGAFEQGGFLVDGGKAGDDVPPVITCRLEFPEAWRIVLIFDSDRQGLHGADEVAAFEQLPAFSEEAAGRLARLTLTQALPALRERDLAEFGAAISELQRVVGEHFAAAQGGRFSSPGVAESLKWLETQGVSAVGQSSWGPTGFAIVESETRAYALVRQLKSRAGGGPLLYTMCRARNHGAEVHEHGSAQASVSL
jgi:beta-ribofuranosylaminobenzene 5'-phosphate synthase